MGHEDEGDAGFGLQALQFDLHFLAQLQIQRRQAVRPAAAPWAAAPARGPAPRAVAGRPKAGWSCGWPSASSSHQRQHPFGGGLDLGLGAALHFQTEADVLRHGQMRKQRIALEHRVHRALVRRQVGDVLTIQQDLPEVGISNPAISRSSVVLPQPEGPSRVKNSPLRISHRHIVQRPHRGIALSEGLDGVAGFDGDFGHWLTPGVISAFGQF